METKQSNKQTKYMYTWLTFLWGNTINGALSSLPLASTCLIIASYNSCSFWNSGLLILEGDGGTGAFFWGPGFLPAPGVLPPLGVAPDFDAGPPVKNDNEDSFWFTIQ